MAIVDMDKISLVGLQSQKRKILKFLMKKEIVQIDDTSSLAEDEELGEFLNSDGNEQAVSEYEQRMSVVSQAIATLDDIAKTKKGLFAKPKLVGKLTSTQIDDLYSIAAETNALVKHTTELKANENNLKNKISTLVPWTNLDIPLEFSGTKLTKICLGTLATSVDLEQIQDKLSQELPESVIGIINQDKMLKYVYFVAHTQVYAEAFEIVKSFGFAPVTFSDATGTPTEIIKQCESLISKSEKEREDIQAELKKKSVSINDLEKLYDYYNSEKEQASVVKNLVKTRSSFCFEGWLPREKSEEISKQLTEDFVCCVYITPGDKKEGIPILLKNNALVEPFEPITSMYSLPHSSNIDPNTMVAFFYWLFFGMMLADVGYGLIMAVVCGFISIKFKPDGELGKMIKMFAYCGISTALWGAVFGSIFGGLIPMPQLLNPLEDVMVIMGMSILFGIIHLYVGLGMKAFMSIRDGKPWDALFDVVSWYLFVTGVVILIAPTVVGEINSTVLEAGKWMAIIGMAILVLTQGRENKGLFSKAFGGVKSLYGITGYFGDILSYLRLMALCLSSGVIALVINMLGEMAGIFGAIIIGIIGHVINLLINALGAYVHTSRLQYVEFFGKFYEGGGKAFEPFKLKSKYVTFKEEK